MDGEAASMPSENITVDLRLVGHPGIGHYSRFLLSAILDQDTSSRFFFIAPPGWDDPQLRRANVCFWPSAVPYYSLQEQVAIPVLLRQTRAALFHSPHFLLPLVRPCKSVVTIHDAIYLIDNSDLRSPLAR